MIDDSSHALHFGCQLFGSSPLMRSRDSSAQRDDSAGDKDYNINSPHLRVASHGRFDLVRNSCVGDRLRLLDLNHIFDPLSSHTNRIE